MPGHTKHCACHGKCIFADPLQMSHACHRFGNATKRSRFALTRSQSLAPATQNDASTSKSGAYMWCFVDFDLEMCFAPHPRALFRYLSFQKWSEHEVLCTFWLRNVLRATTVCTFSTSQLQKVVRTWCATFWLGMVLRATTACTFSTSQLLKVLRSWGALWFWLGHVLGATTACNFSSLIWPAGSAPAALASLLFNPPEPQMIGKTVFRDFPTFSRTWIFFLRRLSFWSSFFFSSLLFSALLFSSLLWLFSSLLFICHIVGSLPSKLPSIRHGHHIPYNTVCAPGGFRSGQTLQRCDAARRLSRLRGVSALRRCEMACGRFRVFATSRRCDAATPLIAAGGTSSRHCDAATLRRCHVAGVPSRLHVFATLRRLWGAPRIFATLRSCDAAGGARRLFASSRRCDAADGELLASSRHPIWLRAVARFFAVARCCVDASDAATLQPWGGWWVGLHAVVTSMYWLKRWGLDQIFIFANKQ